MAAALRRNTVASRIAAGLSLSLLLSAIAVAVPRQTVLLWPSGAPGSEGRTVAETVRVTDLGEHVISNVHAPSIGVFLPSRDTATGTAVIVIPGGGHTELWMDHEGYRVAEFLADHGVAAFVLKYRLAHAPGSTYTVEGSALADVQRAIRIVRSRAAEWSLDPDQVGIMGFSAGGELAALAGMAAAFGGVANSSDPVERVSARPRFQALIYPAIPQRSMNLSPDTPPTFLLGGAEDQPAISQGLADLYLAMRRVGARAELHIYDGVGHGFGIRAGNTGPVAAWPTQFLEWLDQQGLAARRTRRAAFNEGWRFFRGEVPGGESPGFQDDRWLEVRLPHDWAIEGPFDSAQNPHTAALPISGFGWYRKTFRLPPQGDRRYYSVEFDGAMSNSRVWLNGHELGGRPNGYIGFAFDLTPYLESGGKPNVLAVRLAPEANSSRWYPGAGIYRNVWLDSTGPVHVARWGTYVTTPAVTAESATVAVRTTLRNRLAAPARISVRSAIVDGDGHRVAEGEQQIDIPPSGEITAATQLRILHPQRWDIEQPRLYSLVTELREGTRVVDRYETPFGVRTVAFDRRQGFVLNGRALKLHGVCLHHDLGALGAAVNRRAIERQLQIMKAAGVNALRTSHNPPAPELLELADRLGFLVIDEAFDMWRTPKVPNGYSKYFDEWSERDLRDMVRRDRNHPSIILWSIGNEIPEQRDPDGWKEARRLTGFFHQEDPTRPTTSAFNQWEDAIRNKLADEVDIPGFNYQPMQYKAILKGHPNWIIYGSETASCVSSRGVYHLPLEKYEKHSSLQLSGYDIIAPRWAYCPDVEFAAQDALPALLGEFVWTGFDYLGEPTPYFQKDEDTSRDWPARSSYFGMVDLAGFPKDRYYLYQSRWSKKPMVHVLPHWNWQGREGQDIPVMVYSNAEEVELSLNGASLGRKKTLSDPVDLPVGAKVSETRTFRSKYRLLWQVPYQPGVLAATAYRGGTVVAREEVRTAGVPARISLIADRPVIQADGDDLSFVTVRVEDEGGNLCPLADNLVSFRVSGAGRIEAVDNGDAATVEPFHADHRKAFNGLALLIVRSKSGASGQIAVAASDDGLAAGQVDIMARP
jgi:beta-galactosidase